MNHAITIKYLNENLTVNDNKKLIPLFEGKFNQFVFRNKGTDLNSPESIINLLNSRSRSFLKLLKSLVIPLKTIDRNMKLKSVTKYNKSLIHTTNLNGTDILTQKIDYVTQLLKNNKLSMPLNLLKPLDKKVDSNLSKYLGLLLPISTINSYQQNIHFNFQASKRIQKGPIFGLLEYAFIAMSCLISKPVYLETPDKININLFYYLISSDQMNKATAPIATSYNGIGIKNVGNTGVPKVIKLFTQNNIKKLNILCVILSRIFKKPVELDLIRLHLPYFDDHILVKAFGIMSKDINVRHIFNIIFTKTKIASQKTVLNSSRLINSYLAGIKIRISGRLLSQRIIPRLTTRVIQKGAITRGKIKYINSSRVTLKNKRGSHSITVTMTHLI